MMCPGRRGFSFASLRVRVYTGLWQNEGAPTPDVLWLRVALAKTFRVDSAEMAPFYVNFLLGLMLSFVTGGASSVLSTWDSANHGGGPLMFFTFVNFQHAHTQALNDTRFGSWPPRWVLDAVNQGQALLRDGVRPETLTLSLGYQLERSAIVHGVCDGSSTRPGRAIGDYGPGCRGGRQHRAQLAPPSDPSKA